MHFTFFFVDFLLFCLFHIWGHLILPEGKLDSPTFPSGGRKGYIQINIWWWKLEISGLGSHCWLEGLIWWPYFLSRASFLLPMVPNGPRSRGCWIQSLQRTNSCSPLGGGMRWSLIALGRGAYLGPNCLFIYSFSRSLFSSPLAFLNYQGLQFLSSSRVTDVIPHFLEESLSAGT